MIKQDSDVCHLVSEEIKPKKIHSIVITYSLELVRIIAENLLRMWFLKIIGFFIAKLFIDLLII